MPGVWIGLWANCLNILFNWSLIYALGMGINGAPWATSLTRLVECVTIVVYIWWNRHSKELQSTWPTLSREMWNYETLGPFCRLAVSGALSISAEAWSFEIATILAGLIGTIQLDAQVITLTLATFIFLSFPFATGIAASIHVGQWIGNGSTANAKRSSTVSCLLAVSVQAVLVIILLPSKHWLGNLFSSDEDVAALVSKLIPISCVFMLGDAVQATVGGVLRGLGRQRFVFFLNILAFWVLAIPIGSLLTFVGRSGVQGLWWGYVIGIYASGALGMLLLKFRISWEKEAKNAVKRLSTLSTHQLEPSSTVVEHSRMEIQTTDHGQQNAVALSDEPA